MIDTWTREQLYFDGDAFFDAVVAAIESAKKSVRLETYIFRPDAVGRRFEKALARAATRGVQVQLLVDGIGSLGWPEHRDPELEPSGVAIRVYHPLAFSKFFERLLIDLGIRKKPANQAPQSRWTFLARLNRRTHRKLVIIDDEMAFVGSMNIAGEHSAKVSGETAWRDTAIQIEGPHVLDLSFAFDSVWIRSHTLSGERRWREGFISRLRRLPRPSRLVRLNFTPAFRRTSTRENLRLMRGAGKRLWITNAYFAPSRTTVRALRIAVKRGADVRILIPRHSDIFFMPWVAISYYGVLLASGVRIFEYHPRFLHAKTMLIDDLAMIGSSNLNNRSLLHDFEIDIISSRQETIEALEAQFLKDLSTSEEIKRDDARLFKVLGQFFSAFFSNWI